MSYSISRIDVASSLAELSSINNFVRPNILEDQTLNIVGGRHPSVELAMIKNREGQFHSNNCLLKVDDIIWLITGPNMAGKSTFLSAVSQAKPKIADYPFTTLHPNLGVVGVDQKEFVLADIPGLIEGAHGGAGLGTRFLGHVERCRLLLHLVDGTSEDVEKSYRTVRHELTAYSSSLAEKTEIVTLNKCDALTEGEITKKLDILSHISNGKAFKISGFTSSGVEKLLRYINVVISNDSADNETDERMVFEP